MLGIDVVLVSKWEVMSVLLSMTILEADEPREIVCPSCVIAGPPGCKV